MGPEIWLYDRSMVVMLVKLLGHELGRQPVKLLLFTCRFVQHFQYSYLDQQGLGCILYGNCSKVTCGCVSQ